MRAFHNDPAIQAKYIERDERDDTMNIRTAILQAADHIERHPELFKFSEMFVPPECDTPGCALGWIGHFCGMCAARTYTDVAHDVLCLPGEERYGPRSPQFEFYSRMERIECWWAGNGYACARTLRAYADTYHPAAPDSQQLACGPVNTSRGEAV